MQPQIYRLSYTTLSLYERGDFDAAVASYLGKPHPYPTPAMELGKTMHELWENYINDNLRLPEELGGDKLVGPVQTEKKHERLIELGDNRFIQLVGVIDLEANGILYDWKVTMRSVLGFSTSRQRQYYKLLIPEAEIFEFRAYNPLSKQTGVARMYLNERDMDEGLEWVISQGTDFINTLEQMYGTADKQIIDRAYKPEVIV